MSQLECCQCGHPDTPANPVRERVTPPDWYGEVEELEICASCFARFVLREDEQGESA